MPVYAAAAPQYTSPVSKAPQSAEDALADVKVRKSWWGGQGSSCSREGPTIQHDPKDALCSPLPALMYSTFSNLLQCPVTLSSPWELTPWTGCDAAARGRTASFVEAITGGMPACMGPSSGLPAQAALQQQAQEKKKKPPAVPRAAGGEKWWDSTLLEWPENDFRCAPDRRRHAILWKFLCLRRAPMRCLPAACLQETLGLLPACHLKAADGMLCSHKSISCGSPVHSCAASPASVCMLDGERPRNLLPPGAMLS